MPKKSLDSEARYEYAGLPRLLHQRARLSLLTSLAAHPYGLVFNELKRLCRLTDGNLSRHLALLQSAGLVDIRKDFHRHRPRPRPLRCLPRRTRARRPRLRLRRPRRTRLRPPSPAHHSLTPQKAPQKNFEPHFMMQSTFPHPVHVAIIMDGNGRWAARRGWPRARGHAAGAETVRRVVRAASRLGLRALTLYAFPSDNWRRSPAEVAGLLHLLAAYLRREREPL